MKMETEGRRNEVNLFKYLHVILEQNIDECPWISWKWKKFAVDSDELKIYFASYKQ